MSEFSKNTMTLKDYLEYYSQFGFDELNIVELYINDKNLETEFSEMVIRLTAAKLKEEQAKFSWAREIVSGVINNTHHKDYTKEENAFIDKLTYHLAFYPEDTLGYYENEIREKIPNMVMPTWCFRDVIAVINYKYGIWFKGQKRERREDILFINDYVKKCCNICVDKNND